MTDKKEFSAGGQRETETAAEILFVNTCVRRESRTCRLARCLLNRLGGRVTEVRPDLCGMKPLNEERLAQREELLAKGMFSAPEFSAARAFAQADIIVIAAPYWDLAFPAFLKIYLENVTVCGVTFRYNDAGVPEGLCRAGELYYVTTVGGPILYNCGYEYVRALAGGFYGITDTHFLSAEGLDLYGADTEGILREAMERAAGGSC